MMKQLKKEQIWIMILFGILLLVISIPVPQQEKGEKKEVPVQKVEVQGENLEEQLEEILQKMNGVGRTEVLITYKDQGRVVVEKDETISEEVVEESDSSGGNRKTTRIERGDETIYAENELPYVIQTMMPAVEGVLVVAEGGGNEAIKKKIEGIIVALFGLETHKISIMKMEVTK